MAKLKELILNFYLYFFSPFLVCWRFIKIYKKCLKIYGKRKKKDMFQRVDNLKVLFFLNNSYLLLIITFVWAELFLFYFRDLKVIDLIDLSFIWIFYEKKIITICYPIISFYYWFIVLPFSILKLYFCYYLLSEKNMIIVDTNYKICQKLFLLRLGFNFSFALDDERTKWDTWTNKPSIFFLDKIVIIQVYNIFIYFWIIISNILMYHMRYTIMSFLWNIGFFFSENMLVIEFIRFFFLIFFIWLLCWNLLLSYLTITKIWRGDDDYNYNEE
jgi:hypothetical protein